MSRFLPALLASLAITMPALAQDMGHANHAKMDDTSMSQPAKSPSTEAYEVAMEKMHEDMMAVQYTGNADIDFMRGMLPHHQGAVDMANIVLKYGKDRQVRDLAEQVIKSQSAEITMMQSWLAEHPATP